MNEFAKEEPPEGFVICTASDLASFRRAHDSSADPKLLAADDRAARAVRKAFAVERSSEYAAWESSRSAFVRTAWADRGGGGSGRL